MIQQANRDTFGKEQLSTLEEVPNIIDESVAGRVYIGYAQRGVPTNESAWRIKRILTSIDETTNITTIGYVNGKLNYDSIWDLRATYNYL